MSVRSIHLTAELRARLACAVERTGKTTQSFILEAITEKLEREELRPGFEEDASGRFANIVASGKTITWVEMRRYLEERVAGRESAGPGTSGTDA